MSKYLLIVLFCLCGLFLIQKAKAQTPTDDPGKVEIENQIDIYKRQISNLQSQEKSLSNDIALMNSKIQLTQYQIQTTQKEIIAIDASIVTTTNNINNLEVSLNSMAKVLLARIVATYEASKMPTFNFVFSSDSMQNYVKKLTYLRLAQSHDKQLMVSAQTTQNDFEAQKQELENEKQQKDALQKQLTTLSKSLSAQEANKKDLLAQTQGSESNYLKLLAAAEAQLANFGRFVDSQGGASLLSNQTNCDSWGCYYNQRDSQWGALPLNGTRYTLASDGCLLTDVAMVFTHFGHRNVNPVTINSNPANFASYFPAYLQRTVYADGTSLSRDPSPIDGELAAGRPIIVGISYDNGPMADHFVTLISGSNGNYQMLDPYLENGHNIPFTDHYTMRSIRITYKITMQ